MLILRHIVVTLVIIVVASLLFFGMAERYPAYFITATVALAILIIVRKRFMIESDDQRGWRVGHAGRDAMFYEEFREGTWHRIEIEGEMLTGKAHHIIYFGSLKFPDWAQERRAEIIERIKSEFSPPDYEYSDT